MNTTNSALIVVDVQRGFSSLCPLELPVPTALEIVPIINKLLKMPFKYKWASKDWHPADHSSFKPKGPYNVHCVQNTIGSHFLPELDHEEIHAIFRKGYKKDSDAPSMFKDHPTALLALRKLDDIFIVGICTNICVWETAYDCSLPITAITNYAKHVYIVEDACATLDLPEDHPYNAITVKNKAISMGIQYIQSKDITK